MIGMGDGFSTVIIGFYGDWSETNEELALHPTVIRVSKEVDSYSYGWKEKIS